MEQSQSPQQIGAADLLAKHLPDDPKQLDIASLEKDLKDLEMAIAVEVEKNKRVIESLPSDAVARESQMSRNPRLKTWTELLEKKKTYQHVLNAMLFARRKTRQAILAMSAATLISIGAATSYFVAKQGLAEDLKRMTSDLQQKVGEKDLELSKRESELKLKTDEFSRKVREVQEEAEKRAKTDAETKQREVGELTRKLEEASKTGNRAEILKAVGNILQIFAAFDFMNPDDYVGSEKVSDILGKIKDHFTPGGNDPCGLQNGPFSETRCACFKEFIKLKEKYPNSFCRQEWRNDFQNVPIPRFSKAEAPHVQEAFDAIGELWKSRGKDSGPKRFAGVALDLNGYKPDGSRK
jgi:hypothetical protein